MLETIKNLLNKRDIIDQKIKGVQKNCEHDFGDEYECAGHERDSGVGIYRWRKCNKCEFIKKKIIFMYKDHKIQAIKQGRFEIRCPYCLKFFLYNWRKLDNETGSFLLVHKCQFCNEEVTVNESNGFIRQK